jgi:hypothetical protein
MVAPVPAAPAIGLTSTLSIAIRDKTDDEAAPARWPGPLQPND